MEYALAFVLILNEIVPLGHADIGGETLDSRVTDSGN